MSQSHNGLHLYRRSALRTALKTLTTAAIAAFVLQQITLAAPPPTMPSGGSFVAGSGAISSVGNGLTINQSSLRGIIDWNSFSIGQGGVVRFNNASGATLNRVTGGAMSSILGSLVASGSVYVINPEGVLIGPKGRIATGGDFVASTLNLSNASFLTGGSLVFQGNSTSIVKNLGDISSSGGSVFLIAHSVENGGTLKAPNGTVGLGAGQQILLKDSTGDERVFVQARAGDVTNTGGIAAAEAELKAAGGNIYALAGNNGGQIRATGTAVKDGHVWLISDGGQTTVSTNISAENFNGAGGAVETSGRSVSTRGGHVKTGRGGSWLLDPDDLTIDSTLAGTIQTSLNGGTDVTEQTSAPTGGGNGDISVASNIAWTSNSSLTLSAYRNVTVNNGITVSNTGAGNLILRADNKANGTGAVAINGNVNFSNSTGAVSILYDPTGANKYTSPVAYTGSQVQTNGSVPNQFTAYMLVNNATDLQHVGLTGVYGLGANIDAASIANFSPIAPDANWNSSTGGFSGIFDGQSHTISNLKVNAPSNDYSQQSVGLFGKIGTNGVVRNLGLTGENVSGGYWNTGGLAGENYGTIAKSYTTGTVQSSNGSNAVGGLVGSNDGSISNSYSTSTAASAATSTVGGLVGWNGANLSSATVSNSYSTGAVSAAPTYAGGFAGENDATITNSYWDNQASTQSAGVGTDFGVVTQVTGLTTAQFQNGTLPGGLNSTQWLAASGHYPVLGWQAQVVSGTVYSGSSPLGSVSVAGLADGATLGSTTTNASGFYKFSLFPGTNTSILTYLTGASTGNTFSDGGTTGTYTGMNIYTGSLRLISGTKTTYSGMVNALGVALGSNSGAAFLFTLSGGTLSLTGGTNLSLLNSASSLTIDQAIAATGTVFASATGSLTVAAAGTVSATGAGDALALTTGGTFVNNAGVNALGISSGGGRWLVYSQNPASDTLGGLAYNFKQYAAGYGTTVAQASGNGVLYTYAPSLTVSLTGAVAKTYDATATASLSAGNYSLSGVVGGDTVTLNNPVSGTYADKNAGTGKAVTVSGLAIASAAKGAATVYGYQFSSSSASGNVGSISPKQLSDTLNANNKVYDGTTAATATLGTLIGVLGSDTVSVSAGTTYSFDTKNAGTGKTVTTTGLSLAGADAANYSLAALTSSADITAKPLTAAVTAGNKVYDGTADATATLGSLTGIVGADSVSLAGSGIYNFADKNVGTAKTVTESGLSLTGADAGNYNLSALTGSANITAKPLTAVVSANDKVYDGTTSAAGSTSALTGVIGTDDVSFTGLAGYAFADKNVGTAKTVTESGLSLTGVDAGNYALGTLSGTANITARQLTAAVTANNKVYDGTTAATANTGALNGVVVGDTVGFSGTGTYTFADKNVGTGKTVTESGLTLGGADAANYSLTVQNGAADITAATAAASFTASNKVYDATTAATGSLNPLSGVIGSDTVVLAGTPTYAFSDKNAGNGKTVSVSGLSLSGADAGNYTLNVSSATASISQATLDVSFSPNNKVYDGTTAATGAFGSLNGVLGSDDVTLGGTASYHFADKNVGVAKAVAGTGAVLAGADAGNYTLHVNDGAADITQAPITVSLAANNKVYDGTTIASGSFGALSGAVSGDNVSLDGTPSYSFADKNVGVGKTVTGSGVTLSGADAGNYLLTLQTGTADITPATLTAGITANSKVYDGTTVAAGSIGPVTGIIGSDTVNLSGTPGYSFTDKNVGTGKTVTGSGAMLAGADAANYVLNLQTGAADITQASITASLAANNKVYDGTTVASATFGALNGAVVGDDVALTGNASYNFADKKVGIGKTVTGSGVTLAGTDAGNYLLTLQTGAANITPATLTAGITANSKVYDGVAVAAGSLGSLTGIIGSDTVSLSGTPSYSFSDKNVGTGKTVTGSGAMLAGADAANYILNLQSGTADITPANLIFTSAPATRSYGEANPAFTGTVTGFVNGETLASATTGTPQFTSPANTVSAVGRQPINGSGLTANYGNYVFEQAPTNATALTIVPAPSPAPIPTPPSPAGPGPSNPIVLVIAINNATRLASQPNPRFSATYIGSPIPGVDISGLLTQLSFVTAASTQSKPGAYAILASAHIPGYSINVEPGVLTVVDNSPETIPTQLAIQPAATPAIAQSTPAIFNAKANASDSVAIPSPVGPHMLGSFGIDYSVNWSKLFDSLAQSDFITEASFLNANSNSKNKKKFLGGPAH